MIAGRRQQGKAAAFLCTDAYLHVSPLLTSASVAFLKLSRDPGAQRADSVALK